MKKYLKSLFILLFCTLFFTSSINFVSVVNAEVQAPQKEIKTTSSSENVAPLSIVNNPSSYLNKTVSMKAKFDKFSTLGLDYKTAYRSSEEYISFLIKRDDTEHDIPLSEMKLFLKRKTAEKFIDLKTDDEILITGTVFSDVLGDSWIDVQNISILKAAPAKSKEAK